MANINFNTPKGTAQLALLNTPDTAFNQNAYKVELKVPADEAKDFIAEIEKVANDNFGKEAKAADRPYKKDDETGEVILKFKSKYKPKLCDASGAVVRNEPRVGGGSTIKVKGNFYAYEGARKGVSLQMSAVQIIDLVEHGGGSQFDAVKGGSFSAAEGANDNYDF